MANALFAFENRDAGERTATALRDRGFPAGAVQVHADDAKLPGRQGRAIDEQISGGLIGNLLDMFRGVIEWGSSPHDAAAFEETVRRGGAVLVVEATGAEQRQLAEDVMQGSGFDRRTDWSDAPQS